jgi:polar amino acid transport system substrate-binding protein
LSPVLPTRKGETELQTAIQKAFDSMKTDGTYKALLAKWGLEGDAIE